ncbi:Mitochondrial assembly of ribosomal large subunit protein 1, variant 2 [Schistosoma haematobium]|uniref:Mitochondrial assembly of ribosomal large subunit protein 1 n=2 Tax=Schistosoma haematobium TaxID=6185 RepID=A0A095B1Z2_SCHHA|nr:Mitochondrial assembly of ribosomal large subunit protein 1, variant 2 [Schistosoma haematobium]KAH9582680.1 Mitochondrial assembly of ribosomal large subunit protein 1, variant 2 [Schistosoma haematobium]CAH8593313.1 unnamed protein product [Schistosoma haematobium]CAH8600455.1 unnamed protein product [Schistosoma haematobium]
MLLLQKIRANLLTATPKILSRFNNHSSGHYCTESKSPIEQESINNNVEEDTVFEVYDEHWEVNPVVEQLHISPKMRPEENLSFIRMENLFDIPELVEALKRENIRDIVCLNVDRNFLAPYMVIGNGVSKRHIQNTVVHIHKLLKYKLRNTSIPIPLFQGIDGSCEWIAVDMSTIFLHLFLPSTRLKYDLESLWCAGPQYDDQLFQKNTAELPNRNFNWEQLLSEIQQAKQC